MLHTHILNNNCKYLLDVAVKKSVFNIHKVLHILRNFTSAVCCAARLPRFVFVDCWQFHWTELKAEARAHQNGKYYICVCACMFSAAAAAAGS